MSKMNEIKQRFPCLSELVGVFEKEKTYIVAHWMRHEDVHAVFSRHRIKEEFFIRHFGIKVIDYTVGIILGNNKLGNCHVIGAMLMFFDKKNIPLDDVFMICVNLKNTINALMLEYEVLTLQLLHEISYLIDHNFSGVIREYVDTHYEHHIHPQSCFIEHESRNPFPAMGMNSSVTPAYMYLQEIDLDMDIIDELEQIERETYDSLDLSESINAHGYFEVINLLDDYLKMINQLIEFKELGLALTILTDLLKSTNFDAIGDESKEVLAIYIKAIIGDFSIWRSSVFVNQNAEDIHYLDQTLLSSIAQLQIMFSDSDATCTEEIEFF